jgi:hypothetical protein
LGGAPASPLFYLDALSKTSEGVKRKDTLAKRKQRLRDEGCKSLKSLAREIKLFRGILPFQWLERHFVSRLRTQKLPLSIPSPPQKPNAPILRINRNISGA